jgi:hypothetical protein
MRDRNQTLLRADDILLEQIESPDGKTSFKKWRILRCGETSMAIVPIGAEREITDASGFILGERTLETCTWCKERPAITGMSYCDTCRKMLSTKREHKEEGSVKLCSKCGVRPAAPRGSYCKECRREYQQAWKEKQKAEPEIEKVSTETTLTPPRPDDDTLCPHCQVNPRGVRGWCDDCIAKYDKPARKATAGEERSES